MNKYRKEYCEENGMVKINPENTKLYDYIKHLENKLEQAENERLREFVEDFISVQKENYGNATNTHLKMIDLAKQAQELISKANNDSNA